MNKLKLVDICAGTGAFSTAFENTGKFETIYAIDNDPNCSSTFNLNHSIRLTILDVNTNIVNIPNADIITAGFPCQPFSNAGLKLGFHDERSNVFWSILKIIKRTQPRFIVLENVKNLKTHDNGKTFSVIINNLADLGYSIKYKILDTSKITRTPHHRERIYIVCFKNKEDSTKFEFPENLVSVPLNLSSFINLDVPDKYFYTNKVKCYDKLKESVVLDIMTTNTIYQYRRFYVRENKNNLCPTLTANMGSGGHNVPILKINNKIRKLTPQECFKLQGFPESFKLPNIADSLLYKQVGNAVSLSVVQLIADRLASLI